MSARIKWAVSNDGTKLVVTIADADSDMAHAHIELDPESVEYVGTEWVKWARARKAFLSEIAKQNGNSS